MKRIFELVALAILTTSLGCRPPSTNAPAQDATNAPAQDATNAPAQDAAEAPAQDAAEGPRSLEQQLIRAQQSIVELQAELHRISQELAAEKASAREAVVKLEVENQELKRHRDELEKHLAERVRSEAEAMAALRAAQDMVAALMKERDKMRAEQASKPPPKGAGDAQRQDDQADRSKMAPDGETDDPFGVTPAPETDAPSVRRPPAPDHDPFG